MSDSSIVEKVRITPRRLITILRGDPGPRPPTERMIFFGPLVVGTLFAVMLIVPPQAREIYISIIGQQDWIKGILAALSVLWLSATLFAWNENLVRRGMDALYAEQPSLFIDQRLSEVRALKAVLAAAIPLLGLTYGVFTAIPDLKAVAARIHTADPSLSAELAALPVRFFWAGTLVSLACIAWLTLLKPFSRVKRLSLVSSMTAIARWPNWLGISTGIAIVLYALPLLVGTDTLVKIGRFIGPIPAASVIAIALVPTITVLARIVRDLLFMGLVVPGVNAATRWLGAPMVAFVAAAAIAGILGTNYTTARRSPQLDPILPVQQLNQPAERSITSDFEGWLKARGIEARTPVPQKPYPVLVVAAQGGGIYAAAATMRALTRLQERCSRFSEHVFAISAVSGGAIGASIYRGSVADSVPRLGCDQALDARMAARMATIATADHISPLLLATPIDWLSKLPALLFRTIVVLPAYGLGFAREPDADIDGDDLLHAGLRLLEGWQQHTRGDVLKNSFQLIYRESEPNGSGAGLHELVSIYWKPEQQSPALVLAATSVETGHRVAFAPFSMIGVGDGTLHSFTDLGRQLQLADRKEFDEIDLMSAAITSARFPGVLPAWALQHTGKIESSGSRIARRLNFVDGGYADNSGATTAFDIIERLKKHADAMGLGKHVSFRLVLLTDSESNVDIPRISGTRLPDIIAPATAVLTARQLLASTAITRAKSEMLALFGYPKPDHPDYPIVEIVLDHRMFPLPLGWLLSPSTERIIALMLGSPSKCSTAPPAIDEHSDPELRRMKSANLDITDIVRRNSCAMKTISDLL